MSKITIKTGDNSEFTTWGLLPDDTLFKMKGGKEIYYKTGPNHFISLNDYGILTYSRNDQPIHDAFKSELEILSDSISVTIQNNRGQQ